MAARLTTLGFRHGKNETPRRAGPSVDKPRSLCIAAHSSALAVPDNAPVCSIYRFSITHESLRVWLSKQSAWAHSRVVHRAIFCSGRGRVVAQRPVRSRSLWIGSKSAAQCPAARFFISCSPLQLVESPGRGKLPVNSNSAFAPCGGRSRR